MKKKFFNYFLVRVISVLISIIFSLFILEFILLKIEKTEISRLEKNRKIDKYEHLIEKKIEKGAVIAIPGQSYLKKDDINILPFSGISMKETIFGNENNYLVTYFSDRHGFRNDNQIWNEEKIDFLLIGDSYIHGAMVLGNETISGNLKKKELKVLNLGYGGTGSLSQYAILREYLPFVKADKILWFYYEGNDNYDLIFEKKNKILLKYLEDKSFSQDLILKQALIDEEHFKNFTAKNKLKKDNLLGIRKVKTKSTNNQFSLKKIKSFFSFRILKDRIFIAYNLLKGVDPKFKELSELFKEISFNNDCKLYFVYLPEYHRFKEKKNYLKYERNYKNIKNIIQKNGIVFIDIAKFIEEEVEDPLTLYPFREFGHFNAKGYEYISNLILKKIK